MSVSKGRAWQRRRLAQRMAVMERVCERIAAGESLAEVCRDPMVRPRSTIMYWCQVEPALHQMLARAREICPEARRVYHPYSEAIVEALLAGVAAGRGLAEVCVEGDMPVVSSVYRWLDERPEFAARYARAKELQAERLFDLAWRVACETEADPDAVALARLQINTLKWRVAQLAPRRYGRWKPQEAPGAADGAGLGETGKRRQIIEIRRFAVTPANRTVETTDLVRGLTRAECWRLGEAVKAGRFTETPDGTLTEVAWRDFDCGEPPAWLVEQDRRDGGTGRGW